MEVHIFDGRDCIGLTPDASAGNLPPEHGPWKLSKTIDMKRGEKPRIGVNTDKALDAIESQGYYLTRAKIGSP